MDEDAMPPGLLARLRAAGYRPSGQVGAGASGPAWAVERIDGPAGRAVVRELTWSEPDDAAVRERMARLRDLRSDHLAPVVDVVHDVRLGCLLLVREVTGPTLAAVVAARGCLTPGEVVTLCVPLAQAIASLHETGLVHGDVSPANVVVDAAGRPVLVDLWSVVVPGHDLGTPGFASAGVRRGEPVRPCDDVYGLARTCLWAWAEGSGAEGAGSEGAGSDGGPDEGVAALRGLLDEAAHADAVDRSAEAAPGYLSAAELAERCFRAVAARPLLLPEPAALVRAEIVGARRTARAVTVTRRARQTTGRRARPRRRGRYLVAAVVLVGATGVAVVAARNATDSHGPDPVAAAVALTQQRTAVIVSGEVGRLVEVEVEDSPAFTADEAVMAGLHDEHVRIEGLSSEVTHAELVAAPSDRTAAVAVTSQLSAHTRRDVDGTVLAATPRGQSRTVELLLRLTPAGWRVESVADPG